jgi:hypothetical protein
LGEAARKRAGARLSRPVDVESQLRARSDISFGLGGYDIMQGIAQEKGLTSLTFFDIFLLVMSVVITSRGG